MSNINISVIVAARDEYIDQLKSIITPLLIQGFNSIYQDALEISQNKKVLYKFQELLKEIPNWNQTILQAESKRVKQKCNYIMDIVTAIFVSNVKILASIRLKGNDDNIRVKIPTSDIFIHSIYIEAAQQIFYDPYLFYHRQTNNFQEKKETVKKIIRNSVDITIRQMLPFDDILQEYLKKSLDDNADNDSDEDTEPEPVSDSDEESLDENDIGDEFDEESLEEIKQIETKRPLFIPQPINSQLLNPQPLNSQPFQPTQQKPLFVNNSDSDSDESEYSEEHREEPRREHHEEPRREEPRHEEPRREEPHREHHEEPRREHHEEPRREHREESKDYSFF